MNNKGRKRQQRREHKQIQREQRIERIYQRSVRELNFPPIGRPFGTGSKNSWEDGIATLEGAAGIESSRSEKSWENQMVTPLSSDH